MLRSKALVLDNSVDSSDPPRLEWSKKPARARIPFSCNGCCRKVMDIHQTIYRVSVQLINRVACLHMFTSHFEELLQCCRRTACELIAGLDDKRCRKKL